VSGAGDARALRDGFAAPRMRSHMVPPSMVAEVEKRILYVRAAAERAGAARKECDEERADAYRGVLRLASRCVIAGSRRYELLFFFFFLPAAESHFRLPWHYTVYNHHASIVSPTLPRHSRMFHAWCRW